MFTLTQKKLLKLLALNSRFSNKDLAKSLGVSADTVDYQIKNLFEKKNLGHLGALFDYTYLGFIDYHYLIRVNDISMIPFKKLEQLPFVIFANTCFGSYDLQLIFVAKKESEAQNYFDEINTILEGMIIDTLKFTSNFTYKYTSVLPEYDVDVKLPVNQKNFSYALTTDSYKFRFADKPFVDKLDIEIIHKLINNSRETYLKISQDLGVSRELVRRRVQSYIRSRFISAFALKPHYDQFEYYSNFMLIKFSTTSQKEIQQYVDSVPEIFYAGRIVGTYSAIVYVVSRSPNDFTRLVKYIKIRFKEQLLDLQLFYFDKVFKQTQFPGIELFSDLK